MDRYYARLPYLLRMPWKTTINIEIKVQLVRTSLPTLHFGCMINIKPMRVCLVTNGSTLLAWQHFARIPTYPHTHIPTYPHTHIPTYPHTHIPNLNKRKTHETKRLGFKKKPIPSHESPLLKSEDLPNSDNEQPRWLKAWNAGDQMVKDMKSPGGTTVV